jgi:hypothetical protein
VTEIVVAEEAVAVRQVAADHQDIKDLGAVLVIETVKNLGRRRDGVVHGLGPPVESAQPQEAGQVDRRNRRRSVAAELRKNA